MVRDEQQILRAGLGLISSLKGKAKVTVIQGGNIMVINYHPRVWSSAYPTTRPPSCDDGNR